MTEPPRMACPFVYRLSWSSGALVFDLKIAISGGLCATQSSLISVS